jgi:cyanophycinase
MIPTASTDADAAAYYEKLFRETWGCPKAASLDIRKRADAFRPDFVEAAAKARGIWFGGGDQVLITEALLGTPVGDAIAASFARGAVVGGTSAGTACQSRKMITGEGDFTVLRSRVVEVKEGLGFLPAGVVVDQHFVVRKRLNRLLSVVLENPGVLGVGVDEETAAWVRPDGTMQVLGKSCIVVVDLAGADVTVRPSGTGEDALGVHGMRLHVLLPGEQFDLGSRKVIPPAK